MDKVFCGLTSRRNPLSRVNRLQIGSAAEANRICVCNHTVTPAASGPPQLSQAGGPPRALRKVTAPAHIVPLTSQPLDSAGADGACAQHPYSVGTAPSAGKRLRLRREQLPEAAVRSCFRFGGRTCDFRSGRGLVRRRRRGRDLAFRGGPRGEAKAGQVLPRRRGPCLVFSVQQTLWS